MMRIARTIAIACALALPLGACSWWEYMFGPGEFTEVEMAPPPAQGPLTDGEPAAPARSPALPTGWGNGAITR